MTRAFGRSRMRAVQKIHIVLLVLALQLASANDRTALNVSITTFDPGVPGDMSSHRDLDIFPRIREIEAMFLPFVLREVLGSTNEWGAVRVVPEADDAAELLISGTIVRSDGESLELRIRAVDASGHLWFDDIFGGVVTNNYATSDYESGVQADQNLYDEIAERLHSARAQLNEKTLTGIVEISLLRYANELAPTAFGDYLDEVNDGTFAINRLPARDDPMLERITRIRGAEYVITDAVDEKFEEFHAEIASIYDIWREYRRKVVEFQEQNARWVANRTSSAPRGSYEAISTLYSNYKLDRITEQRQDNLAVAFNNEVGPTIAEIEARIAELEGWVDEQYAEWNMLLEELFEVETRLEQ